MFKLFLLCAFTLTSCGGEESSEPSQDGISYKCVCELVCNGESSMMEPFEGCAVDNANAQARLDIETQECADSLKQRCETSGCRCACNPTGNRCNLEE